MLYMIIYNWYCIIEAIFYMARNFNNKLPITSTIFYMACNFNYITFKHSLSNIYIIFENKNISFVFYLNVYHTCI